jgi:hypothetical protein
VTKRSTSLASPICQIVPGVKRKTLVRARESLLHMTYSPLSHIGRCTKRGHNFRKGVPVSLKRRNWSQYRGRFCTVMGEDDEIGLIFEPHRQHGSESVGERRMNGASSHVTPYAFRESNDGEVRTAMSENSATKIAKNSVNLLCSDSDELQSFGQKFKSRCGHGILHGHSEKVAE